VTMRMPTLRPIGEGCISGEAIDMCTRLIRRGSKQTSNEPDPAEAIAERLALKIYLASNRDDMEGFNRPTSSLRYQRWVY
jgi:hypothetical protein